MAFIDHNTNLYEIVRHQLGYILQPYLRACTIITLHTEGDIFVLCQAGNVWIEYTIITKDVTQ